MITCKANLDRQPWDIRAGQVITWTSYSHDLKTLYLDVQDLKPNPNPFFTPPEYGETDAEVWARAFLSQFPHFKFGARLDDVITWFANAIESGRAAGEAAVREREQCACEAEAETELREAYDEATELADGEAVDACGVILEAVNEYLRGLSSGGACKVEDDETESSERNIYISVTIPV